MAIATSKTKAPAKAPAKSATGKTATKPAKAVKAAAPKTATAKAATPRKTATAKPVAKPKATRHPAVTPDQRSYYIEVAAYYIAERRGFHGGSQLADWAQAEKEIEQLLAAGRLNP